jgi:glycosyltransferase involved in cell wall biosynthesis
MRGYVGDVAARAAALRQIFDEVDVAIAPSEALKDVFVRNSYPAARLRLSRYGLDTTWLVDLQPKPADSPLCVGYIGQIEPIKGVDVLIDAFRSSTGRDWQLKIYGGLDKNQPFAEHLRMLAAADPRVQFMGQFDRSQIADAMSQLDVVVVPSVWFENTPVVIAEAFAARKPVIATDLPGMSELVTHNVNGLLFPRGDVAALAGALGRFADEPGLAERLASAIEPVRSIEEEAAALAQLYAQVAPRPLSLVS